MSRRVGVDIGATEVRVVEVSGIDRDGFAVISRVSVQKLPEGAVRAGKLRQVQPVAVALQRAFKEAKIPTTAVVLGIAAPEAAVTRQRLPGAVKPDERTAAIRNRGTEISPLVPLPDATLAINHVRTETSGEGQSWDQLVVAAALTSDIEALMGLSKLARIVPRAVDLSGAALLRSLVRVPANAHDVATIVDVGATSTTVVTREGPHARSLRTVPTGGDDVTRALQEVRGDTFDEADRRKQHMRFADATPQIVDVTDTYGDDADDRLLEERTETKVEEAFNRAGDQLIAAIAASVEHDASVYGTFTQAVSLTGSSALLGGLKERLQQRLGVPVQIGRPWATVAPHKRNEAYRRGDKDDPVILLKLATAVGLALWKDVS